MNFESMLFFVCIDWEGLGESCKTKAWFLIYVIFVLFMYGGHRGDKKKGPFAEVRTGRHGVLLLVD